MRTTFFVRPGDVYRVIALTAFGWRPIGMTKAFVDLLPSDVLLVLGSTRTLRGMLMHFCLYRSEVITVNNCNFESTVVEKIL